MPWGLPSAQRAQWVLVPAQRTPAFYAQIDQARQDLYTRVGENVAAFFGRTLAPGQRAQSPVTFLNAYSSFLVKTHELDEAATLVMVSRLNPLKNRWFPHSFLYGGAYLFPLAALLGVLHVAGLIHLVPAATFYYLHPDAVARIYVVIRLWALVGFLSAISAVFFLGRAIGGEEVGQWSAWFFSLTPIGVAFSKVAKPHTWAASWTLWALLFCLKAKEDQDMKWVLCAGLLWGLALGTTVTQVIFAPFFIWAAWSSELRFTWRRGFLLAAVAGCVFLLSNFYLVAHFSEYLQEQAFLRQYSPFHWRAGSLLEFLMGALRFSLGWELWLLTLAGGLWAVWQKHAARLRSLILLGGVTFVYTAFQMQAQHGAASLGRLFIALFGGCSIVAAALTYQQPWGKVIRWIVLLVLFGKAGIYAEHFRSDRMPMDNASQAALWIQVHVPSQSVIIQATSVPQTDDFPPIAFSQYNIVSLQQVDWDKLPVRSYAVIPGGSLGDEPRSVLVRHGFTLAQAFAASPLQRWGYDDPFTHANFRMEILVREGAART